MNKKIFIIISSILFLQSCFGIERSFKVTYISNGGTSVDTVVVNDNQKINFQNSYKEGYILNGWYLSSDNGASIDLIWNFDEDLVDEDLTLYADWIVLEKYYLDFINSRESKYSFEFTIFQYAL